MNDYIVQLKELPPQLTLQLSVTVTIDTLAAGIGQAFDTVMAQAATSGATFAGPPFVMYPEAPSGEFTVVLCMPVTPVSSQPAANSGVKLAEIPGGRAACVMHKGPYSDVHAAYDALQTWMTANRARPAGPPREVYLNEPDKVSPEELLTEVVWPVA